MVEKVIATLTCYCGHEIPLTKIETIVTCPICGNKYIYKRRSDKYVYAGR